MSDIDLLVVIDSPVTDICREQLVRDLMDISGLYPIDPKAGDHWKLLYS